MDCDKTGCQAVDRIHLAHDTEHKRAVVKKVMNPEVS
jgi:hypothetical protein